MDYHAMRSTAELSTNESNCGRTRGGVCLGLFVHVFSLPRPRLLIICTVIADKTTPLSKNEKQCLERTNGGSIVEYCENNFKIS
jgi:hypothetical protein